MARATNLVLQVVILSSPVLAQAPSRLADLSPDFRLEVAMSPSLEKDLPKPTIKNDMELILRRNGIGITDDERQILQLTINAKLSADHRQIAINLRLELLTIGFTLGTVAACAEKPTDNGCWASAARRIGVWNEDRLLTGGAYWQPEEARQNIKDPTEAFALFYLRRTQNPKK